MNEIREKLKPLVGKRIKFRGYLAGFEDWTDKHLYRDIGRACISQPERDSEVLADHVWVLGTKHWPHDALTNQVEFDAIVASYWDEKNRVTNYCLKHPGQLNTLHGPPAVKIPDIVDDLPERAETSEVELKAANPLDTLRAVKTFIKEIGGQEQAAKVAAALEAIDLPVSELISWVKALGE